MCFQQVVWNVVCGDITGPLNRPCPIGWWHNGTAFLKTLPHLQELRKPHLVFLLTNALVRTMAKLRRERRGCSVSGWNNTHSSFYGFFFFEAPSFESLQSQWNNFVFEGCVPTAVLKPLRLCTLLPFLCRVGANMAEAKRQWAVHSTGPASL